MTKSFFIISPYWTGSGLSNPKSLRTACSVAWSALRPAMRAAGSTPGVAKKMRKTSTLIEKSTSTIDTSLRAAKRSIRQRRGASPAGRVRRGCRRRGR